MSLLTKVKTRLALHARRPVSGLLDGHYASRMAGRSLDFADLRQYQPGDDVSDIDWKASARHGELLVKRFVADRKHTVFLVVDTGRELAALTTWGGALDSAATVPKSDLLITAAGVLGWIAIRHGDYVGLVHLGESGPCIVRPSTRELELERMLLAIQASSEPDAPRQDTAAVLEHAVTSIRRRTIMFVLLGDVEVEVSTESLLRRLVVQHEVVVITVADLDPTVPGRAGEAVSDVGSGRRLPGFAVRSTVLQGQIEVATTERRNRREAALARLGISYLHVEDADRLVGDLLRLVDGMHRGR